MSPKRKDKNTRFVIFASPEQYGGPGNRFIGQDGNPTASLRDAYKAFTWEDAREFAKAKGITIDGAMTSIGKVDVSDFDLRDG